MCSIYLENQYCLTQSVYQLNQALLCRVHQRSPLCIPPWWEWQHWKGILYPVTYPCPTLGKSWHKISPGGWEEQWEFRVWQFDRVKYKTKKSFQIMLWGVLEKMDTCLPRDALYPNSPAPVGWQLQDPPSAETTYPSQHPTLHMENGWCMHHTLGGNLYG